jgi:hypothetical protein
MGEAGGTSSIGSSSKKVGVLRAIILPVTVGLVAGASISVSAAIGAESSSSWGFIVQATGESCGYGQARVNNTSKVAIGQTKNVLPNLNGACGGAGNGLDPIAAGFLGVEALLVNDTHGYDCGYAGVNYTNSTSASITVTVNKITSPNCPGASGQAYYSFSGNYKWKASESTYYATSRTSPDLNFN